LNLVSFAHGETFMLGAFIGLWVIKILNLPFLAALCWLCGGWLMAY
jgi:branched-subunit amino acid ABC-type transport system permease component